MDNQNNTNNKIGGSSLVAAGGDNILERAFAIAVIRGRIRMLSKILDGEDV